MRIGTPPLFSLASKNGNRLVLTAPERALAHVFVLEEDIIRVMVLPDGKLDFPNTWAIAPGGDDVPTSGRDRFDLDGFSLPPFSLTQEEDRLMVETAQIRLTITLTGLFCHWETKLDGRWHFAATDRTTQNVNFGWWDEKVYHYLKRDADEMYFGLGERAGLANRHGQRYLMRNVDALGYSARTTDPLYKHIPFYLTRKSESGVTFGLFYDTLSDCAFDMGRELDNYHGHYRYFVADHGDLDYYFIAGQTPGEITRRYTWLTGRPAFTPRWGLGYSGSTMSYTDAPNAAERMEEFLDGCREHDILCDSFHLSSGYTSIDGKRYVFNWNREKFPDPAKFIHHYLDHGVKLCPNIKPCLLRDHPRFAEAQEQGLFIHEADGSPTMVQFWDEVGACLDFTNPKTWQWWKERVIDSLLEYGIAATWNDNNEFEVWNPSALVDGFGTPVSACRAKPLHTLLMLQSSRTAHREFEPGKRPFLVSRSGAAGMQRYVQTWSGDNTTSWETLRYNIKMGLGLAMSGISNTGHDIGGFSGPKPEAELFLRWVQHGIFLPRFSIHSWNDDQTANEPWMYPEITPHVRELIRFRYRLMPYLYNALWKYHDSYEPMIRPTFYDFSQDTRCYEENDDMMLGADLLVASVVEPGVRDREVYLPGTGGWYDFWTGDHYAGGQTVLLPAPWDRPPLLAREGAVIPLNTAGQHFAQPADQRAFAIFPPKIEGKSSHTHFEDDGESTAYLSGKCAEWTIRVAASETQLSVNVSIQGDRTFIPEFVELLLPPQEVRPIAIYGGRLASDELRDGWRVLWLEGIA